jgi:hypothetical protein
VTHAHYHCSLAASVYWDHQRDSPVVARREWRWKTQLFLPLLHGLPCSYGLDAVKRLLFHFRSQAVCEQVHLLFRSCLLSPGCWLPGLPVLSVVSALSARVMPCVAWKTMRVDRF